MNKVKHLTKDLNIKRTIALIIILLVAIYGSNYLITGHAQSPYTSIESESGSLVNPAIKTQDSSSSGSASVAFGSNPNASAMKGVLLGLDTPPSNDITAYSQLGKTPSIVNMFSGWEDKQGAPIVFPTSYADSIIAAGSTPMITWQPSLNSYATTSVLTSISNGSYDSYITTWATAAKAENHTIYLRFMHEFNGSWYPWGEVTAGVTPLSDNQFSAPGTTGNYPYTNTSQMYVAAYNHVVQLFKNAGATNVQFIWCFSTGASITNISTYYPGDADVSWPSMDGYNRSTTSPNQFSQIFTPGYNAILSFTKRPIYIAEMGSVEFSGLTGDPMSKSQWITDAFLNDLPNIFPHIKGVNYFDSTGAGYTYPIDSSPSTLTTFQSIYANPNFQATAPNVTMSF